MGKAVIKSVGSDSKYSIELDYDDSAYKYLLDFYNRKKEFLTGKVEEFSVAINDLLPAAREAQNVINELILKVVATPQKKQELRIKEGVKRIRELTLDDKKQQKESKEASIVDFNKEYDDLASIITGLQTQLAEETDADELARIQNELNQAVTSQLGVGVLIGEFESDIDELTPQIDNLTSEIEILNGEISELNQYIKQYGDKKTYEPQLEKLTKQYATLATTVTEEINKKNRVSADLLAVDKKITYFTTEPVPAKDKEIRSDVYCVSGVVPNAVNRTVGTIEIQGYTLEDINNISGIQSDIDSILRQIAQANDDRGNLNQEIYTLSLKLAKYAGAAEYYSNLITFYRSTDTWQDLSRVAELENELVLKEREKSDKQQEISGLKGQKEEKDFELYLLLSEGDINTDEIQSLRNEISSLEDQIEDRQGELYNINDRINDINLEINFYRNQLDWADKEEIANIVKGFESKLQFAASERDNAARNLDGVSGTRLTIDYRISQLESDFILKCREKKNKLTPNIYIQPSHVSAYNADRDGRLVSAISMSILGVFYALAILPGWEKWKPTYRRGTITALVDNKCNISLEERFSRAQKLNINQSSKLEAVEFDYPPCQILAFKVNDFVVVKFKDQDWTKPQVIGFAGKARSCLSLRYSYQEWAEETKELDENGDEVTKYDFKGWNVNITNSRWKYDTDGVYKYITTNVSNFFIQGTIEIIPCPNPPPPEDPENVDEDIKNAYGLKLTNVPWRMVEELIDWFDTLEAEWECEDAFFEVYAQIGDTPNWTAFYGYWSQIVSAYKESYKKFGVWTHYLKNHFSLLRPIIMYGDMDYNDYTNQEPENISIINQVGSLTVPYFTSEQKMVVCDIEIQFCVNVQGMDGMTPFGWFYQLYEVVHQRLRDREYLSDVSDSDIDDKYRYRDLNSSSYFDEFLIKKTRFHSVDVGIYPNMLD
jgi:septal ring factor EnvC (AmiA/AmiB activator)